MSSASRTDNRPGVIRSAAFKLTLGFAGLFVAGLLAVDLTLGVAARHVVEASLRGAVDAELGSLLAVHDRGGDAALIEMIAEKSKGDDLEVDAVGLHGPDGGLLAGSLNLPARPAPGWTVVVPEGIDEDEALWVKTARLADGRSISVAAASEPYHDIWELMTAGAAWSIAIALPFAVLSGALLSRIVLGRLARIAETVEAVRRGDLSQRASIRGRADEFDRLAGDINAMLDTVETLTRNLRNVSVGIAHELRTPLAHIRNRLVEIGQIDGRGTSSPEAIDGAIAEIDQVLETFDALLKIGQIEADAERRGFEAVPLSELVTELADVYEPVAVEQGKQLTTSVDPDIVVSGNRALLVQMISNLLENAIEHTPGGTHIKVELAAGEDGRQLVVSDDGPGIPAAETERVFERFYRLERSRSKPGTGLGLSLVRSICALHGLKVAIDAEASGTRFLVRF